MIAVGCGTWAHQTPQISPEPSMSAYTVFLVSFPWVILNIKQAFEPDMLREGQQICPNTPLTSETVRVMSDFPK